MIIGIDVDGVLLDIQSPWIAKYNHISGDCLQYNDITQWRMADIVIPEYALSIYDMRTPDLYYIALPICSSQYATIKLISMGHQLVCVSHDRRSHANAKGHAIRRHFPWIADITITGADKSIVKCDVLIDDAVHNKPDILFDQPWNRSDTDIPRAESWISVVNMIGSMR